MEFNASVLMSTCDKTWRFPSNEDIFNDSYVVATETKSVIFDGVYLTNCPFVLSLTNITNPLSPTAVTSSIIGLTQPILITDSNDPFLNYVG